MNADDAIEYAALRRLEALGLEALRQPFAKADRPPSRVSCVPDRSAVADRECVPERLFYCTTCRRWVSWDCGAADDHPDLCDDCVYEKRRPRVAIRFT